MTLEATVVGEGTVWPGVSCVSVFRFLPLSGFVTLALFGAWFFPCDTGSSLQGHLFTQGQDKTAHQDTLGGKGRPSNQGPRSAGV